MILLFLPTLGLSWFWFSARRHRYFTDHTRFGTARFHSTIAEVTLAMVHDARMQTGVRTVCLSGGVFQNRRLAADIAVLGKLGVERRGQVAAWAVQHGLT